MEERPHVLVVDDNEDLAEVTCTLFSMSGVSAIYRTTVSGALEAMATHAGSIAVLLTDINMSTPMSGIELAVYVSQEWPDVVICATSGETASRSSRLPEKAHFVPKPWHMPDLLALVATSGGLAGPATR